jgi:hypothetical protein
MTKVVISKNNGHAPFWHVVNFLGPDKCESRGIVDLIAIRKNHRNHELPLKRGDLFDIVLIQVKGGSAPSPSPEERKRLRIVGRAYKAAAILLSEWKKGSMAVFKRLVGDEWVTIDAAEIFGPRIKAVTKIQSKKTTAKADAVKKIAGSAQRMSSEALHSSRVNAGKKAWETRRAAKQ